MSLRINFQKIYDPRDPRGKHYDLDVLLTAICLAMLGGADSNASIARWMVRFGIPLQTLFQLEKPMSFTEGGLRKLWRYLDASHLAQAIDREPMPESCLGPFLHVDGKALRGRSKVWISSVFQGNTELVLAQDLHGQGHEIETIQTLLDSMNLKDCWITADALHLQKKQ